MRHAPTHPKICGALPCENDQAKPDRISRLARSTNLSKILAAFRLSGALLDRGPGCYAGVSSNLLRSPDMRLTACAGIFARTFQSYRTFASLSSSISIFARGRPNLLSADRSSAANSDLPGSRASIQRHRTARNIKERPEKRTRADGARRS